jgi:hypothetical protein
MKPLRAALLALLILAPLALRAQTSMPPMDHPAKPKATPSTALMVMAPGKMATYTPADLATLPQKTVKVANAHTHTDQTYTGPLLTDVLAKLGTDLGKPLLRAYVKAQGTDHYWVLFSGIEIDPASHLGDTIVALTLDGHPLAENGAFQLVSTEDKKPQRWVRNLTALTLVQSE